MLFSDPLSRQQLTIRSNTISDDYSTMRQIEDNRLNNFMTVQPQQVRRSYHSRFSFKYTDQQIPDSSLKSKPYQQSKDNEPQQEMVLIENYLGSHNKFKTYFKSKKYKKIYQQLSKQMPLQKSYYCLYLQDKFYALNKHIKVSLVHKQTSFMGYLGSYFSAGKRLVKDFYRYFLVDDQLYKGTKKVNTEVINVGPYGKSSNVCHFLHLIVTFLYQLAIFYRAKGSRKEAQIYYEANLKIVYQILQSSTSSSSIRRKICQYLISFSSFLIEKRELLKASKILELALQNCINLIAIIQTKLKYCYKAKNVNNEPNATFEKFKKRTNRKLKEAFQFMVAIYLNSSVVFELQNKEYLSYLALNEVQYIEEILYKYYSIKSKIAQVKKKPKQAFETHHEKTHVVKCYFDTKKILEQQREEQQMKLNQNVGIYGIAKASEMSFIKSKDLMELFFDEERKLKQRSEKKKTSIIASKIGLIEYDNPSYGVQDLEAPVFEYTINMRPINGGHSSTVYKEVRSSKQKIPDRNKLSAQMGHSVRRERKKLSKFYDLAMSEKELSAKESTNTKLDPNNSNKDFKKSEKRVTYTSLKSQNIESPQQKSQQITANKIENKQVDFLNQLIDSEISIKRYFLYGKKFVDKYDMLSKGKTLYVKNDEKKKEQNVYDFSSDNKKKTHSKKKNDDLNSKDSLKNQRNQKSSTTLLKRNLTMFRQPFNSIQNQKSSVYVVSIADNNLANSFNSNDQNPTIKQKNRASKSLKQEPMRYREVMGKIEKAQNEFMKKEYLQKNSIYRLKCRSQNVSRSKLDITQMNGDCLGKGMNSGAMLNTMKRENERQAIMFKLENTKKTGNNLNQETKSRNLIKKALNTNLFSSNETGVRLLKKIIFKHKKTLKIVKTDLFVNYNKTESRQEEIKLVEKESLLMVQYQMCEEETKNRIKENMKQLIVDNLRSSEDNEKRMEKLNKAINEYDKNRRISEFSSKIRQEYDARIHEEKFVLAHNPQYFENTFAKKGIQDERKDSLTSDADSLLKNLFEKRILESQTDHDPIGLGANQKFLTGNRNSNPNLFLSSIKYKQDDNSCKKIKTLKYLNKGTGDENMLEDDSALHGSENDNEKAIALEKFLGLFQDKQELGIKNDNKPISNNWV